MARRSPRSAWPAKPSPFTTARKHARHQFSNIPPASASTSQAQVGKPCADAAGSVTTVALPSAGKAAGAGGAAGQAPTTASSACTTCLATAVSSGHGRGEALRCGSSGTRAVQAAPSQHTATGAALWSRRGFRQKASTLAGQAGGRRTRATAIHQPTPQQCPCAGNHRRTAARAAANSAACPPWRLRRQLQCEVAAFGNADLLAYSQSARSFTSSVSAAKPAGMLSAPAAAACLRNRSSAAGRSAAWPVSAIRFAGLDPAGSVHSAPSQARITGFFQ